MYKTTIILLILSFFLLHRAVFADLPLICPACSEIQKEQTDYCKVCTWSLDKTRQQRQQWLKHISGQKHEIPEIHSPMRRQNGQNNSPVVLKMLESGENALQEKQLQSALNFSKAAMQINYMSLAARSLQTRTLLAMKNYQECEKSLVLWFQVSPVSKEAEIVLGKFLEATR